MGYQTYYSLVINSKAEKRHPDEMAIIEQLRSEYSIAEYALDNYGGADGWVKWYEHTNDLKVFSRKHPEAIFVLHGEGETKEDIWVEYIRDGKAHQVYANTIYDDFDEKKLV